MTHQHTPVYALPYPEGSDIADVPTDLRELATATEAAISGVKGGADAAAAAALATANTARAEAANAQTTGQNGVNAAAAAQAAANAASQAAANALNVANAANGGANTANAEIPGIKATANSALQLAQALQVGNSFALGAAGTGTWKAVGRADASGVLRWTATAVSRRDSKRDIEPVGEVPVLDALTPVRFRYRPEVLDGAVPDVVDQEHYGFIAEDVPVECQVLAPGDGGVQDVDARALVALLWAEVQRLAARVTALEGGASPAPAVRKRGRSTSAQA